MVISLDIFQWKLDDIYKNTPNVTGIANDIIVFGSTEEEHDQAFVNIPKATRVNNVSLNSEKLQFKQQSVNFFGHTLTKDGILPTADKLEAIKNISTPSNIKELVLTGIGQLPQLFLGQDCRAYRSSSFTLGRSSTIRLC